MAKLIRYESSRSGMRELAKSRAVDAILEGRARSVAQVAQSAYDSHPPHQGAFHVEVLQDQSDSDRARVAVLARHPAALAYEADHRILGSAISAARH
jgi:hypothetical protein